MPVPAPRGGDGRLSTAMISIVPLAPGRHCALPVASTVARTGSPCCCTEQLTADDGHHTTSGLVSAMGEGGWEKMPVAVNCADEEALAGVTVIA